jgi:hypothetical protein
VTDEEREYLRRTDPARVTTPQAWPGGGSPASSAAGIFFMGAALLACFCLLLILWAGR